MNSQASTMMGLGFELVGLVLAAVFLGQQLDEYLDSQGLAVIALTLLVFVVWTIQIIIVLKKPR